MTRVPKFRAWVSKDNVMGNVVALTSSEDVVTLHVDYPNVGLITLVESDNVIVMQSTGLKDCNGVYLFEGDIVTASGYEYMGVGVVRYEEKLAGFVVEFTNRLLREKPQFIYQFRELEVIGNVYENEELLE